MASFYARYHVCKILENDVWIMVEPADVCIHMDIDTNEPHEAVSVYECAKKCSTQSSHFAYGTNNLGGQGCIRGLCNF